MHSERFSHLVASIYDAALEPRLWPSVLGLIGKAVGAAGAGYALRDRSTGRIDWLSMSGPLGVASEEYLSHYSALDPYRPLLEETPTAIWLQVSRCLPSSILR